MTNAPIRIIVLLATLTMIGIVSVQVYWSTRAIDSMEQQFSHNVKMSLQNVVESVCQINGTDIPLRNPIEQVSNAYFIVHTNQPIQLRPLEQILITEFENREIREPFEFGVYDCQRNQMIYGKFVSMNQEDAFPSQSKLPALEDYDYYFGVFFPQHRANQLYGLDWLKVTTAFTVLIFLFFGYTIFILLRQKKLSAIQRDFINNIMHEFKTPIASIKIAAEVLSGTGIARNEQRLNQYAAVVSNECARLESHVSHLLKSAETESALDVTFENIAISDLLNRLRQHIDPILGTKTLKIDVPQSVSIIGDAYMLETILFNLIENAIKYGGDHILLSVIASKHNVQIDIEDDGVGIARKEAKKVFQKFYRISEGNQHNVKGFGLGLYVVKLMVEKLEGSIELVDPQKAHFKLTFHKG